MFQHRIEDRQQFVHAGRERHLLGFPRALQPLIEGADHGIKASRDDRAHIEDRTHLRASTPDRGNKNGGRNSFTGADSVPELSAGRHSSEPGLLYLNRSHLLSCSNLCLSLVHAFS